MVALVGRVRAGVFLVERDPVCNRKASAAVLDRPAKAGQTGGRQMLVPRPPFVEGLVLAPWGAEALERGESAGQGGGEPVADPGPEVLGPYPPCRLNPQPLALF